MSQKSDRKNPGMENYKSHTNFSRQSFTERAVRLPGGAESVSQPVSHSVSVMIIEGIRSGLAKSLWEEETKQKQPSGRTY